MSVREAVTALRRFGLGARPGELKRIASDPRGFILQSLTDPGRARIDDPALEPSHVVFAAAMEAQRQQRLARANAQDGGAVMQDGAGENAAAKAARRQKEASVSGPSTKPDAAPAGTPAITPARPGQIRREAFVEEAAARFRHAATTDAAFLERLVMFWSNHFCVSANKGPVRGMAGAYERETIRPHVLGRFTDMLLVVEKHPAMIVYLDNQASVGPKSRAGTNRGLGLNENLARETLELHTLGVGGGYSQEDVTNFARILTGWTVGNPANARSEPGKFFFAPARHEPGEWTVLGKRYPDRGQQTGEDVLRDLADHPATARHIAGKLARHFVAEEPPAGLVAKLEKTFLDTKGDLAAVATTLAKADEAWAAPPAKVLPPYDFLVAVLRGLGLEPKPADLLRLSAMLGEPLWRPPAPAGWPDADTAWAAPSSLRERLRIAEVAARQADRTADPRLVVADLFGEAVGPATAQAIARAETREQGLELLIMSPDFQRR
jgi:uncharacterized protein (DUF1800 family)